MSTNNRSRESEHLEAIYQQAEEFLRNHLDDLELFSRENPDLVTMAVRISAMLFLMHETTTKRHITGSLLFVLGYMFARQEGNDVK